MSWPKELPWPMPGQFTTHSWVVRRNEDPYDKDGGDLQYTKPSALPGGCKFCLVGWVRNAFRRTASPLYAPDELPREGVTMLRYVFEELTGEKAMGYGDEEEIAMAIATVMDGDEDLAPMTPRQASGVMRRVLRRLNYELA